MSIKIGSLYSELGFRVDFKKLRQYEKKLQQVNRNLNESGRRFQKQLQSNNKSTLQGFSAIEKRVNKHRGQLWQMRNDYRRINQEFHRGNISHERRSRMLREITHQYSEQKRHIRGINKEHSRSTLGRVQSTARALNQPVKGSGGVSAGGHYKAGATAGIASRLVHPAAMGAAALAGGSFMSNQQYQRFESVRSGFTALEGSTQAANERLRELASMANYFGQRFMPLAEGYKSLANNLKGSAIEDEAMKIYTGLQAYGTAMGLNQHDLAGIQLAIGQIAAAGRVQGDELNQLAERGISRNLLADAMGISLEEFMKRQGSQEGIQAENILPALGTLFMNRANVGGALEQRRQSTQAEQNRAVNNATFANIVANQSGINAYFKDFYQGLQEMLKAASPIFEEIGEAFKGISKPTRESLSAFGNVLGSIGNVFDSMDGVKVSTGVVTLAYVLNNLAEFINDVADTIDLIRSDSSWRDKLSGISTMLVNQFERIAETFINAVISKVNILLPKAMELSSVNFQSNRIHTPTVDISGVQALLGGVNESINRVNREAIAPLLNSQGGISDPTALPFGPVTNRNGQPYTTVNQNNTMTFNIDGSKQPDEILGAIEDHINGMLRSASMNDSAGEK
ncbi:tape measure protein [Halomonas salinarum]|uniref:tape measure protein n=1 Tax=Halomonas salinarum TaxID=1158993 RepID=UPI00143902FE|nr:tape measure protein [Halomonas salinarum]